MVIAWFRLSWSSSRFLAKNLIDYLLKLIFSCYETQHMTKNYIIKGQLFSLLYLCILDHFTPVIRKVLCTVYFKVFIKYSAPNFSHRVLFLLASTITLFFFLLCFMCDAPLTLSWTHWAQSFESCSSNCASFHHYCALLSYRHIAYFCYSCCIVNKGFSVIKGQSCGSFTVSRQPILPWLSLATGQPSGWWREQTKKKSIFVCI